MMMITTNGNNDDGDDHDEGRWIRMMTMTLDSEGEAHGPSQAACVIMTRRPLPKPGPEIGFPLRTKEPSHMHIEYSIIQPLPPGRAGLLGRRGQRATAEETYYERRRGMEEVGGRGGGRGAWRRMRRRG